MNITVPKNIKSPTVIIVGQNQVDDEANNITHKRLDMLESKLDQQYKAYIDKKTDYFRIIERMQKSFMDKFDKIVSMNKEIISNENSKKIDSLKSEFRDRVREINVSKNDDMAKSFITQIRSLENAIKNIPKPQQNITVIKKNTNGTTLNKSFETMFQRLEKVILMARPRMIPSPS